MAIATDKSLKMFEIIPPAATEFPSIINSCQDKFIKKCNPIAPKIEIPLHINPTKIQSSQKCNSKCHQRRY